MKPRPPGDGQASAGDVVAIELPLRPWSELFHAFLGWSEGLMLFLEEPEALGAIAESLERSLRGLVESVASGPGTLVLSPDNLDGQFIAPNDFQARLAPSYRASADLLHAHGKRLVVHVGGPVGRILPLLASCGIDCVEGICGPPQGDTTLAEARRLAGPGVTLWGGIPQDYLLATHSPADLEKAARAAFEEAAEDGNAIVGVADKVPADALPERLEALARLAAATPPR
jgi:hypothetical protein